jgi:hypothetical protein
MEEKEMISSTLTICAVTLAVSVITVTLTACRLEISAALQVG